MLRKILSVTLVAAFFSQSVAWAQEPAHRSDMTVVPDRAALPKYVDGLSFGERVRLVADDEEIVGDYLEQTDDELVVDRLMPGGSERTSIPLAQIQGLQLAGSNAHGPKNRAIAIAAAVATVALLFLAATLSRPMP